MVQVVWLSSHRLFYGCAVKRKRGRREDSPTKPTPTLYPTDCLGPGMCLCGMRAWDSSPFSSYLTQACRLGQYKLICTLYSRYCGIHSIPYSAMNNGHEDPLTLYWYFPHKNRGTTTEQQPLWAKSKGQWQNICNSYHKWLMSWYKKVLKINKVKTKTTLRGK